MTGVTGYSNTSLHQLHFAAAKKKTQKQTPPKSGPSPETVAQEDIKQAPAHLMKFIKTKMTEGAEKLASAMNPETPAGQAHKTALDAGAEDTAEVIKQTSEGIRGAKNEAESRMVQGETKAKQDIAELPTRIQQGFEDGTKRLQNFFTAISNRHGKIGEAIQNLAPKRETEAETPAAKPESKTDDAQ